MKRLYKNSLKRNMMGPAHLIALMNVGLFSLLAFRTNPVDVRALTLGFVMVAMVYAINYVILKFKMGDTYIPNIVSMLVSIGLVMQYRLSPETGMKQFIWFLAGTAFFMAVYHLYARMHQKIRWVWLFYGGMISLFVITLVLGSKLKGARNWIAIGEFTFQPSEFIKILFVFFMAVYAADPQALKLKIKSYVLAPRWVLMGAVFGLLGLFALQKEFGTALVVFMVYISFLYVFERGVLFPLINIGVAGAGALAALKFVHHLKVRVDTWLNPWEYIDNIGYQITQSLFAIGTGSFFGTGIGLGNPEIIPAVHTDFIFAAICEETGILGGIAIVMLYFLLVYRGIKIALRIKDRYSKAVGFGLTITLGYQTFIILGGVIKLIPLTGITLPFISYGGSSLVSSYMTLGIIQALSGQIMRREAAENGHS